MRIVLVHNKYGQVGGENLSVTDFREALEVSGVEAALFEAPTVVRGRREFEYHRGSFIRLVDEFKPDVAIAFNLFPFLFFFVPEVLGLAGVPWFHSVRNYRNTCTTGSEFRNGQICNACTTGALGRLNSVVHRCYRGSALQSIAGTGALIGGARAQRKFPPAGYFVFSNHMEIRLRERVGPTVPVHVVPNVVSPIREIGVKDARNQVVHFSGRIEALKGADFVIDLASRMPNFIFEVFGSGPKNSSIRSRLNLENIRWQEQSERLQSLQSMATALVTLVPSRYFDPLPRTILESLALGTPVISSPEADLAGVVEFAPGNSQVLPLSLDRWETAIREVAAAGFVPAKELRNATHKYFRMKLAPEIAIKQYLRVVGDYLDGISE